MIYFLQRHKNWRTPGKEPLTNPKAERRWGPPRPGTVLHVGGGRAVAYYCM